MFVLTVGKNGNELKVLTDNIARANCMCTPFDMNGILTESFSGSFRLLAPFPRLEAYSPLGRIRDIG
jgi:hypothetical protein